jgi:phosphatidylserine decarboxylase
MKKMLMDLLMPVLPKNDLSHAVGRFVHIPIPGPIGRKSVELFARYYDINLDEAEHKLEMYPSIGALFTRKLKEGVRPLGEAKIVHPADALITEAGPIDQNALIQAKGRSYSVQGLLGGGPYQEAFDGGEFATYYLCPTDYHRVHSPVDGKIVWSNHIPGALWPVNDWSTEKIPNLFNVNERIVTVIETEDKKLVALVMVAATNVGNMTMSYDDKISSKTRGRDRKPQPKTYDPGRLIRRGDEIGIFHMGSTVVMLYAPGVVQNDLRKLKGTRSKVGASLNFSLAD